MRFLFAVVFLTVAVCAQTPQIKVETQYDTVSITNLYTSPVTALIAWAPLEEPRTFREFALVNDPVAFEPDEARQVIIGSGQRRLLHFKGRDGLAVGVLFADGKSAGDPEAVQRLIDNRRETMFAISSVLATMRTLVNVEVRRSALIKRVEQFAEQQRTAAGLTAGANVGALVSKRTADLLRASDDPASVVAILERWRERLEGN